MVNNGLECLKDSRYAALVKKYDDFLRTAGSLFQVVAINDFHVTKKSFTNSNNINSSSFTHAVFHLIKSFLFFFIAVIYSLFVRKVKKIDQNHIDYLFVSHYTGSKVPGLYIDSYFGKIAQNLIETGSSCAIVYINHTKENIGNVVLGNKKINTVLLERHANFFQLITIYKDLFVAFFQLKKIKERASRDIINSTKVRIFSPSVVRNLIIANQVKDFVKQLLPKYVVTTYEGHAWERLVYYASRKEHNTVKCIAYQHAPIFKYQHAIRRGIGNNYDPDIILTSGTITKQQLESSKIGVSIIHVLGSDRYIDPSLVSPSKKNLSCLVAPEGTIKECILLFSFSLECAKNNSDTNFIFRLPSMVDFELLIKNNKKFENMPKNVYISERSLIEDINQSEALLYRGSSVAVNCGALGVKPIYFKTKGDVTIDPLYEINDGKFIVSNCDEFFAVLSKKVSKKTNQRLKKYCNGIYTQLNMNIISHLPEG
jgi:hypothetical protein